MTHIELAKKIFDNFNQLKDLFNNSKYVWLFNLDAIIETPINNIYYLSLIFYDKDTGIVIFEEKNFINIYNNILIIKKLFYSLIIDSKLLSTYYKECSNQQSLEYDFKLTDNADNTFTVVYIENLQVFIDTLLKVNVNIIDKITYSMQFPIIISQPNIIKGFLTLKLIDNIYEIWDVCTPILFRNQKIMSQIFTSIDMISLKLQITKNVLYMDFNNPLWDVVIKFYIKNGYTDPKITNTSIDHIMFSNEILYLEKLYPPLVSNMSKETSLNLSNRFKEVYINSIQNKYDIYYLPVSLIKKLREYISLDREYYSALKITNRFNLLLNNTQLEVSNIVLDSKQEICGEKTYIYHSFKQDSNGYYNIFYNSDGNVDNSSIFFHTHPYKGMMFIKTFAENMSDADMYINLNLYKPYGIPFNLVINNYGLNFMWFTRSFNLFINKYNYNHIITLDLETKIKKLHKSIQTECDKNTYLYILYLNTNSDIFQVIRIILQYAYTYIITNFFTNYQNGLFTDDEIKLDNYMDQLINIYHDVNSSNEQKINALTEIENISNLPNVDKYVDNLVEYIKNNSPGKFVLFKNKKIQHNIIFTNLINSMSFKDYLKIFEKLTLSSSITSDIYKSIYKIVNDISYTDFIPFHFEIRYFKDTSDLNKDIFIQIPSKFNDDGIKLNFMSNLDLYKSNIIGKYISPGNYTLDSLNLLPNIGEHIDIPNKSILYPKCTTFNKTPILYSTYIENRLDNSTILQGTLNYN